MKSTIRRALLMLALALPLVGLNFWESISLTFHMETTGRDSESFAVPATAGNPPHPIYIEKTPSITEREIAGIYPFPAADGTFGCAFKLDQHGTMWLSNVSGEHHGTSMVILLNQHQICDLLIDRQVTDGIVTIPNGLTSQQIELLKKRFKLLGKKKKKD